MARLAPLALALLTMPLAGLAACGGDDADTASGEATPAATTAPGSEAGGPDPGTEEAAPEKGEVRTIATGLEIPWDVEFTPMGTALVTERETGKIKSVAPDGTVETLMTVPGVEPQGEGGLLGIAVRQEATDGVSVFVYFTAEDDNRVAKVDLSEKTVEPILTGLRKGPIHDGGALDLGPDGNLYVGVGEVGDTSLAQDRSSRNGKILRITTEGKVPEGNPFPGSPIWSLGHRNVQGLDWDADGRLWATEFGQNTTDEVNLIQKGKNYGWPIVEGEGDRDGFVNPKVTWSPTSTSSPSGAAILGGELYVGALAGQRLWAVPLNGASAGEPRSLFQGRFGRIRGVAAAPDGSVWCTTSNRDGRGNPGEDDDRIIALGTGGEPNTRPNYSWDQPTPSPTPAPTPGD